ncbi:MAG: hypothetical protein H6717_10855 [Polyangiaceae bacterium]|nr:hypothetical protein [Polyangiaceae bacterium]
MEPSAPFTFALLALCLAATASCGPEPEANAPDPVALAPYTAADSALFDDTFSPDFFGLERPTPVGEDRRLTARARSAALVLAGRVSTVTRDRRDALESYVLVLTPTGVVRGESSAGPITLEVDASSPSFPWIRSTETDLVGRGVILFAKRYNDHGARVLHWHAEADTPEIRRAVESAMLVSEVGS